MKRASPPPDGRIPISMQPDAMSTQFWAQLLRFLRDLWGSYIPLEVSSQAANYTTTGNELVICTAAITVTLNDDPRDMERVVVKRTGGSVTVDGDSNNIDGAGTQTLSVAYDVIDMVYSEDAGEWLTI